MLENFAYIHAGLFVHTYTLEPRANSIFLDRVETPLLKFSLHDFTCYTIEMLQLPRLRGNTTSSPLVQRMKPSDGTCKECIYFFVTHGVSVKVPEFLDTPICLPRHMSVGFCRSGNPMEVIDDCTIFFFGILSHTLRQTGTSSPPGKKKPVVLKLLV